MTFFNQIVNVFLKTDIPHNRSSRLMMFFKIVLEKLALFTGKHLCWSRFVNKVEGLKGYNFIKRATPTQVFSC